MVAVKNVAKTTAIPIANFRVDSPMGKTLAIARAMLMRLNLEIQNL